MNDRTTPVIQALERLLADSYMLYLKTQLYHWNVTGPYFKSLHEMFEEQYEDLAEAIDAIAERIRALGALAPGTFAAFIKLTSLKEGNATFTAMEMVNDLQQDQQQIIQTLQTVLNAAEADHDTTTADFASERIGIHQKHGWMLAATML